MGLTADWSKEGRTTFECGGKCGEKLSVPEVSLKGLVPERGLAFRKVFRKRSGV